VRADASAADAIAERLRERASAGDGVLLFVDQLEELVTLADAGEARAWAELLSRVLAAAPGFRLLATARGDFITRLVALPGLGDDIARSLYFLRPLSPAGLREAIVGPARALRVGFESDALVDELAQAAEGPGGLPLLQFALAQLWNARDVAGAYIRSAALEQLGGVAGALAHHADEVMAALPPQQRPTARRILLRLVTEEGTRARWTHADLAVDDAGAQGALEALVRGRLVVALESERKAEYAVAHEALIDGWPALRGWRERESERRAALRRLSYAAAEWERLGKPVGALWDLPQLGETALLDPTSLSRREHAFLAASRRQLRRRRWLVRGLAACVPLVVLALYAGVHLKDRRQLQRQVAGYAAAARTSLQVARREHEEVHRLRADAYAAFDAGRTADAEASWAQAQAQGARADATYGRIIQELETELPFDPGRRELRALLADALFERAVAAERPGKPPPNEWLERLRLYDDDRTRWAHWQQPAQLSIASDPPGARVTLERYMTKPNGRRMAEETRVLGVTPLADVTLPPGSYRLRFALAGRFPVQAALRLERAERLNLAVALPPANAVANGYVYIPAGRFLFGTAAEDDVRRFLWAAPIHEAATGPYLIARHETTYADWIAFLESLPADERAKRSPHVTGPGIYGGVRLALTPSGWRLEMRPKSRLFAALAGEPLRYPERAAHVAQRWLRMPVSGISLADAEAYMHWLDRTRRVRRARLCDEREWERAARGADEREFPHGDRLAPDDANYDETYGRQAVNFGPDEVGTHPASQSPFSIDDMVGNVLEVVRAATGGGFSVRGGGFAFDEASARSTDRTAIEATLRDLTVGLRVCADAP
jgi:formylglycine-generating enzyme required for sulfatase activity